MMLREMLVSLSRIYPQATWYSTKTKSKKGVVSRCTTSGISVGPSQRWLLYTFLSLVHQAVGVPKTGT